MRTSNSFSQALSFTYNQITLKRSHYPFTSSIGKQFLRGNLLNCHAIQHKDEVKSRGCVRDTYSFLGTPSFLPPSLPIIKACTSRGNFPFPLWSSPFYRRIHRELARLGGQGDDGRCLQFAFKSRSVRRRAGLLRRNDVCAAVCRMIRIRAQFVLIVEATGGEQKEEREASDLVEQGGTVLYLRGWRRGQNDKCEQLQYYCVIASKDARVS